MTALHRFALFTSGISAALLLSACQPAADESKVNIVKDDVQASTEHTESHDEMEAHAGHDR